MRTKIFSLVIICAAFFPSTSGAEPANRSTRIEKDIAHALAVTNINEIDGSLLVKNQSLKASFGRSELKVTSKGGVEWSWQLKEISGLGEPVHFSNVSYAAPTKKERLLVSYDRGILDEEYHLKADSIEQRFILKSKPSIVRDVVISGEIRSSGAHSATNNGGVWSANGKNVSYTKLYVYDAAGKQVPARMELANNKSSIVIDGDALAKASFPVVVDPEIGSDDFRISSMGADGNINFGAFDAAVAYNSTNDQFLVVWMADESSGSSIDEEYEIYGQRIDADDGSIVGSRFRISNMGPDSNSSYVATNPHVAYNSTNNEYLVVWAGTDNSGSLVAGENEIFGQRIDASTGTPVGSDDFRISDLGTDGDAAIDADRPRVAYNANDNEYLVVWSGDDTLDGESEIYGQRLNAATGAEVGTNDFRISDMGPNGSTIYFAGPSDVAFDPVRGEYLVVWVGDDNTGTLVNNEFEVFAQRLDSSGAEQGTNDMRISDMGPDGDTSYISRFPTVAYGADRFLVVWVASDNSGSLIANENEMWGQFIDATTHLETGTNDFRISDAGVDGDLTYGVANNVRKSVAYNSLNKEFVVAWSGTDNTGSLVVGEEEIFIQRISATSGTAIGTNDLQISDMGPSGSSAYDAFAPAVAYNSTANRYFVVWDADDNVGSLADNESEIFGQMFQPFAADLSVTGSSIPSAVVSGSTFSYSLSVTNLGGEDHQGPLTMSFTAPIGVTMNTVSSSGWASCGIVGQVLTCERDGLASGATGTVNVDATMGSSANGSLVGTLATGIIVGTDSSGGNNTATITTQASVDTDGDATPDITDTDDDNDALLDSSETTYSTDPLDSDTDDDRVLDGQEVTDGSNPIDSGSYVQTLNTTFCSEWNGFLGGMWNIQEFVNLSGASRSVSTTLYNISGAGQSTQGVSVLAGAQTDLLVHGMSGWTLNSYGKTCSTHDGAAGDIDGRMVYYKPVSGGYDFAFAMPYQNGLTGEQFVPFNTFQPSLDPVDASNVVTNWIQLTNLESTSQSGTLYFYAQNGTVLGQASVSLNAESRQDFSGHQFGTNLVGTIRWAPTSNSARFQLRNVRYYYDNATLAERFDGAFQLEGMKGNGETLYAPLDTTDGSAILEVANTTSSSVTVVVTFYNSSGTAVATQTFAIPAYGSQHLIADSIISHQLGSATVGGTGVTGSIIATAMHYGRTATAGINWIYGVAAKQALGSNLRGSYNTFLNQSCDLILVSSDATAHDSSVSMTRYDGTVVLAGQVVTVPGHGTARVSLCLSEADDNYGVVTVAPTVPNTVYANVIRIGPNDNYRFPTPVRE